jgi:hypothetical protein
MYFIVYFGTASGSCCNAVNTAMIFLGPQASAHVVQVNAHGWHNGMWKLRAAALCCQAAPFSLHQLRQFWRKGNHWGVISQQHDKLHLQGAHVAQVRGIVAAPGW